MTDYLSIGRLRVARSLHDLVRDEIAPGTGIAPDRVWSLLDDIVHELGPRNRALLQHRDALQAQIDRWLLERRGDANSMAEFLREIGYLVEDGGPFEVTTRDVDPEIATLAGPQLVVPMDNARYALNAANARWGSLYDALYGTNVISADGGAGKTSAYNPVRGEHVIAYADGFLDAAVPLVDARWSDVVELSILDGGSPAPWPQSGARASATRRSWPVFASTAIGSRTCCCAITVCTSTSSSTAIIRSASNTAQA